MPPADALRFPMNLRGELRSLLQHRLVAGGLWLLLAGLTARGHAADPWSLAPLTLYSAIVLFWSVNSILARRRPHEIALSGTHVFVPTLRRWNGTRKVPISALQRIAWSRFRGTPYLTLGIASDWPARLPVSGFVSEEDAHRFTDALALRTRLRPQVLTADQAPTRLALVLALILVLAYVARLWTTNDFSIGLLEWGGINRVLVLDGQWFRLVTSALVQTDPVHLVIHVGLLLLFLPDLQRLMGSAAVVVLLFISTVGGALGALANQPQLATVGASAGAYGLLGAAAWLWFTERRRAPLALFDIPVWALGSVITADLVLSLFAAYGAMSLAGYAMGFIIGAGFTGVMQRSARLLGPLLAWAGLAVSAVVLFAVGIWLVNAAAGNSVASIALTLVTSSHGSLDDANYGAWSLATAANASQQELAGVRDALSARLEHVAGVPGTVQDTLATLHYRTGQFESAVAIESAAMDEEPDNNIATQLARFERAAGNKLQQLPLKLVNRDGKICIVDGPATPVDVDVLLLRTSQRPQNADLLGLYRVARMRGEQCLTSPPSTDSAPVTFSVSRAVPSTSSAKTTAQYWAVNPAFLTLP